MKYNLGKVVTVVRIYGDSNSFDTWQVRLKIDQQSFSIGWPVDTKAEAAWMRLRLIEALARLIGGK